MTVLKSTQNLNFRGINPHSRILNFTNGVDLEWRLLQKTLKNAQFPPQ